MPDGDNESLVFGFPAGDLISVGEYCDYSLPALSALDADRNYECVTVCAVLVDVIMNDIVDHLPSDAMTDDLRDRPVGAIIKKLEKLYSNPEEKAILARLRDLNAMRIRVVHPASDNAAARVSPDNCPKEFAQAFVDQLEAVADLFGGYTSRQFGEVSRYSASAGGAANLNSR